MTKDSGNVYGFGNDRKEYGNDKKEYGNNKSNMGIAKRTRE
jgi:hypothetical protein